MKKIILTCLMLSVPAMAQQQQQQPAPTVEEVAARAQIQIGQLQQAVGQLTLQNIELRKQLTDAQKKSETAKK